MEPASSSPPAAGAAAGPGCEQLAPGLLVEPVAAVTSLAFVVAAVVLLIRARTGGAAAVAGADDDDGRRGVRCVAAYAALVAAVGVGSVVQHGPDPAWSDVAHDAPLLATLAFVAADAAAQLAGRARVWWWWALPTSALLPVVVLAPRLGDLAQVGVAAVAVVLTALRAAARADLRPRVGWALGLLALGGVVGTLSRAGWPWCDPTSPWQGHGAWHLLAAVALTVLAPTIGRSRR